MNKIAAGIDALRNAEGDICGEKPCERLHRRAQKLVALIVADMLEGKTTFGDGIGFEHVAAMVLLAREVDDVTSDVFWQGRETIARLRRK